MPKKFFDIIPPQKIETFYRKLEPTKKTPVERKFGAEEIKLKLERQKGAGISFPKRNFLKSLIFCLVFLILFGIFGYSVFSKVKIEIWPEREFLTFKEKITVDSNIKKIDSTLWEKGGVVPGEIFSDQKSASQEFPASGKILKEEKARGIIRVYNAFSTSPRLLIPSRFVSAGGKLFWSVNKITIPGGKYEKGKFVPGEIDVEIQAAEAGPDYNIGPSTFALPALAGSPLYTSIYGKSFSPMKGGFKGEVSQITKEDIEMAKNTLAEKLKKESRDFLRKTIPADFILLDEAMSYEVIESNSSREAGAEAESFNLQIKAKSEGLGFKKSDIENFAKYFISLNIQEDRKIQEESLVINYLPELIDTKSGKIILNLEIKAKIYSDIDLAGLKKALLGKSLKETEIFLKNLDRVTRVEIKSWPFLRKKVPENIEKLELKLRVD